jgi:glutathione-regulated potassium-efflux system protein KefB
LRETYESALAFGRRTLEAFGLDSERTLAIADFVRRKDLDRLALQQAEGIAAGLDIYRNMLQEPLSKPAGEAKPLNPEAQEIIGRRPAAE